MIDLDIANGTFVCPFCRHVQAYDFNQSSVQNGKYAGYQDYEIPDFLRESCFTIYTLYCKNNACKKVSLSAVNRFSFKQIDILPKVVDKKYPDYIPRQILNDYYEANHILEDSPKAAATLLRRCLQGMIRDFWGIKRNKLNDEINELASIITPSQWKALDGLRKIGNIGAHMEKDVDLIIDIEPDEARKLLKLIELLLDKWYIARHDEEELFADICTISDDKEVERKGGK